MKMRVEFSNGEQYEFDSEVIKERYAIDQADKIIGKKKPSNVNEWTAEYNKEKKKADEPNMSDTLIEFAGKIPYNEIQKELEQVKQPKSPNKRQEWSVASKFFVI